MRKRKGNDRRLLPFVVAAALTGTAVPLIPVQPVCAADAQTYESIQPGISWTDTDGELIQAHGGSVQKLNEETVGQDLDGDGKVENKEVWLWYGEDKTNATRPVDGVKCYTSDDLMNWKDQGIVLYLQNQIVPTEVKDETNVQLSETNLNTMKEWGKLSSPPSGIAQEVFDEVKLFLRAYVTEFEKEPSSLIDTTWTAKSYDETEIETTDPADPANVNTMGKTTILELAFQDLFGRYCIVERPKMLYNNKTKKFIIAYHADRPLYDNKDLYNWVKNGADPTDTNTGNRYSTATMGFAESDTPFGPFKLINAQRMNWKEGVNATRSGESRDMTMFVDQGVDNNGDGVDDAYAVYSSEMNAKMYVSLLNSDYTGPNKTSYSYHADGSEIPEEERAVPGEDFSYRILPDGEREAACIVHKIDEENPENDYYFMMTSGTGGWNSTGNLTYRSQNMLLKEDESTLQDDDPTNDLCEQWEKIGNVCTGVSKPGASTVNGYDSQPTSMITYNQEKNEFIYMGDRWYTAPPTSGAGANSRYVWLPIQLTEDNKLRLEYSESWVPTDENLYRPLELAEEIRNTVSIDKGYEYAMNMLPSQVTVVSGGEQIENVPVTWNPDHIRDAFSKEGIYNILGELGEPFSGKAVSATLTVVPATSLVSSFNIQLANDTDAVIASPNPDDKKPANAVAVELHSQLGDGGDANISGPTFQSEDPETLKVNGKNSLVGIKPTDGVKVTAVLPAAYNKGAISPEIDFSTDPYGMKLEAEDTETVFDSGITKVIGGNTGLYGGRLTKKTDDGEKGDRYASTDKNGNPLVTIEDGTLKVASKGAVFYLNEENESDTWKDYTISLKYTQTSGSTFMLGFRQKSEQDGKYQAASSKNGYMWQFSESSLNKYAGGKSDFDNGNNDFAESRYIADYMNPAGEENEITLTVKGNTIITWLNGHLIDVTRDADNLYPEGTVGIYTERNYWDYNSFDISELKVYQDTEPQLEYSQSLKVLASDQILATKLKVQLPMLKANYLLGEDLDFKGLWLTADMTDGTKDKNVTEEILQAEDGVTGYDKSQTGVQTVAFNYKGKTATVDVTVSADKSALEDTYNTLNGKTASDYSVDSWAAFEEAFANAETILDDVAATEEQVVNAEADLTAAADNLVVTVDLRTLYEQKQGVEQGNYTDATYNDYLEAILKAGNVLDNAEATQEEVTSARDALLSALENLEENPPAPVPADKTELQALYDANKDKAASDYTNDSFEIFQSALDNAADILGQDAATQDDVTLAVQFLQAAAEQLKGIVNVDKTELQALYDANKDIEQGNYTNESYAIFVNALHEAESVLEDPDASVETVANTIDQMNKAIAGLKEKPVSEKPDPDEPSGTDNPSGTDTPSGTDNPSGSKNPSGTGSPSGGSGNNQTSSSVSKGGNQAATTGQKGTSAKISTVKTGDKTSGLPYILSCTAALVAVAIIMYSRRRKN